MIRLGLNDIVTTKGAVTTSSATSLPFVSQPLSQTIAWCQSPQSQQNDFRSPQINPLQDLELSERFSEPVDEWAKARYAAYERAVTNVVQHRASLLEALNSPSAEKPNGRVLVYFPLETVTCGASEVESHGFFDVEDAPPWDTWFQYDDRKIFCWIPAPMFDRVEAGLWANPVDCIRWAEERELSRLTT